MYRQQNTENILKFHFSFVQSCDMMVLVLPCGNNSEGSASGPKAILPLFQ